MTIMSKKATIVNSFEDLRPSSIRIMGREFEVDFRDEGDMNGDLGMCDVTECLITVQEGQHEVEEVDTVLHEAMHGLFYLLDFDLSAKKEEEIVRRLSTGLIQVFKDNPELLTYIYMAGNNRKAS